MSPADIDQTETLIRLARRQLWGLLAIMGVLAALYLAHLVFAHPVSLAEPALLLFTILFAIATPLKQQWKTPGVRQLWDAIRNDELRRFAEARAYRNGFFVLLACPPTCAVLLTGLGVADALPHVIGISAWLGLMSFMVSLLHYDR